MRVILGKARGRGKGPAVAGNGGDPHLIKGAGKRIFSVTVPAQGEVETMTAAKVRCCLHSDPAVFVLAIFGFDRGGDGSRFNCSYFSDTYRDAVKKGGQVLFFRPFDEGKVVPGPVEQAVRVQGKAGGIACVAVSQNQSSGGRIDFQ